MDGRFPAAYLLLPNPLDTITSKQFIAANDGNLFHQRLGNDQTVKQVAVMIG